MLIRPFCSLHAVQQLWCKLVMSFNVTAAPCPLSILYLDEAHFHLCFLPIVSNIIRCGAHSCSTCECVCSYRHIFSCVGSVFQHIGFKMKHLDEAADCFCEGVFRPDWLNTVGTVDLSWSVIHKFEGTAVIPTWRQTTWTKDVWCCIFFPLIPLIFD